LLSIFIILYACSCLCNEKYFSIFQPDSDLIWPSMNWEQLHQNCSYPGVQNCLSKLKTWTGISSFICCREKKKKKKQKTFLSLKLICVQKSSWIRPWNSCTARSL